MHFQKFWIYYTYPPGREIHLYLILRNAFKRSKEKTAHSIQKSKKPIGQNNHYGRERPILYRYCPTKLGSDWFAKKYKFTTSRWTLKLLFCRCRQGKWQEKDEEHDRRNIDHCKNSSEQVSFYLILFIYHDVILMGIWMNRDDCNYTISNNNRMDYYHVDPKFLKVF